MKYSLEQLKSLILPILKSMPAGDEDRVADAIVEIIKQDREDTANKIEKIINATPETPND